MFKKFIHWLSGTAFTSSVFSFIVFATLVTLIRPLHIKSWINTSGIYQKLPDTLVSEAAKKQGTDGGSLNFKDKGVQEAAKKAVTPQFLQTSTENIIDGTFNWVDGKTEKPDFNVNVLSAKTAFADGLASYAKTRYAGLPACARGRAPTTTDPLNIDCRPPAGVDINDLTAKFKLEVLGNKDFLNNNQITADTLGKSNGPAGEAFYVKQKAIPQAYKYFRLTPYIFGTIMLVAAIGFIYTDETKRRGVQKISYRLIIFGIIAFAVLWLGSFGLVKLKDKLSSVTNADSPAYNMKAVGFAAVDAVQADVIKTAGTIAGVFVLLGIIILVIIKYTKPGKPDRMKQFDREMSAAKEEKPTPKSEHKEKRSKPEAEKPTAPLVQ